MLRTRRAGTPPALRRRPGRSRTVDSGLLPTGPEQPAVEPADVAGPGRRPGRPRRRPAGDAAGLLDDLDVVRDVRIVAAGGGADRFDGRMDAVGSGTNVTDSQVRAGTGVTTGRAARIAWHRAALSRWPAAFRGLARSSRRGYGRCIWPCL